MKRIMLAACIVSLAACGGDKDDVATDQQQDWESQRQSLVYSFPDNNQQQVPVPSPVVLRFSSPVVDTAPDIVVREVGGAEVDDLQLEWVDGKRGLILTPENKLKPLTEYVVEIPAVELEKGTAPARNLSFTTRGLYEGPKSQVASDTFEVTRMIPDGENLPVMDFSSFRIQFSQPLDQSTVKYGNNADATVQLIGPGGLVDAHLLVSGHYMTVDPKEDLTPGAGYSLNLTTGITSIYGETLPGGSFGNPGDTLAVSFQANPKDTTSPTTGERVAMVQDIADTGEFSPLTGAPINLVPMASVLLGEDTATQASGTLAAELAFVPNFPDQTPFRVKRGSLIEGASIEVLIGGEVPAGFDSGKVRMDFLSDATGYLLPNPYSNADDAPRQVRLFMDVAVSTETPAANGAITQDLLHIELVGTSLVEDGQMVINAVGVVEPNVLGSERATGLLSFYMKAYEDQDNPPQLAEDTTALEFQSWSHGNTRFLSLGDAIVINFNKGIDHDTVGEVRLIESSLSGQREIEIDVDPNGSALIIQPREFLRRPYQIPAGDPVYATTDEVSYTIHIDPAISGVNGVELGYSPSLEFSFDTDISEFTWETVLYQPWMGGEGPHVINDSSDLIDRFMNQSVVILAAYPGFPCAMDTSERDIAEGISGRCRGSLSTSYTSEEGRRQIGPDDLLPIPNLPSNQSIVIQGSQEFMPQSVSLGESFVVKKLNIDGSYNSDVEGEVRVEGSRIVFIPDSPWEPGDLYSYTLRSNGDDISVINSANDINEAICDGSQAICDMKMRPLKTQLQKVISSSDEGGNIVQRSAYAISGGPDMEIIFRAVESSTSVLQALVAKSLDANANFYHDVDEGDYPSLFEEAIDYSFVHRRYGAQEQGVDEQDLESSPHAYDPGGIRPVPNAAKLISKSWEPIVLATDSDGNPIYDESWNLIFESGYAFNAMHVGCGYDNLDPPFDPMDQFNELQRPYDAIECPERKFTYLHSALAAEVTGHYEEGKGIKVNIWPAQIIGSSVTVTTILSNMIVTKLDSGMQLMRIRYGKDDPDCVETLSNACARTQPQEGWIKYEAGKPILAADVELYIDAVGLGDNVALALGDIRHNLVSMPVTMELKGEISFNENGQMVVDQINQNDVVLNFDLEQFQVDFFDPSITFRETVANFELMVPAGGSHIRYVSEIIK